LDRILTISLNQAPHVAEEEMLSFYLNQTPTAQPIMKLNFSKVSHLILEVPLQYHEKPDDAVSIT
jgi:hypothetical protein